MSDRADGSTMMTGFPKGVKEVYAILAFTDCKEGVGYTVRVIGNGQEQVVGSGTTPAKGNKVAVKVTADKFGGTEFKPGGYVSMMEVDGKQQWRPVPWSVGDAVYVTPAAPSAPGYPCTGSEVERQR
jgi:hypothetical protein